MSHTPLIDAASLLRLTDDPDCVIFDCRFTLSDTGLGERQYREGHLPGARYAHLDRHLSSPVMPHSGRHPLPDPAALAAWLASQGVRNETLVVAYDDLGGAFAARLWWLLRWLGHARAAVLDGGIQAWTAAGGAITPDLPPIDPGKLAAEPEDGLRVATRTLVDGLEDGRLLVIDARAPERFSGAVEPIDPVAGHIPGAINLPFMNNLDAARRFLPAEALRRRFADAIAGRNPWQVVHSCGSGVNACHNLLAMEIAGLAGSLLYAGSWSEWIRSPERPIAVGSG
jgi:thiosulfate/3-mercaptopyruvate sulfurtransferase